MTDLAPPVANARGVTKRFGDVLALDGVDIAILPGQVTGLVGPDAAGKEVDPTP